MAADVRRIREEYLLSQAIRDDVSKKVFLVRTMDPEQLARMQEAEAYAQQMEVLEALDNARRDAMFVKSLKTR